MPRSHVLGVNREGFSHSENRLTTIYGPASNSTQSAFQKATQDFGDLANRPVGPGVTDRVDDARKLMGDETLEEMFLTVPAGSMVIAHWDMFHRASKRQDDARFRPMFAYRGIVRMSEPDATDGSLPAAPDAQSSAGEHFVDSRDAAVAEFAAAAGESAAVQSELNAFVLNGPRPVAALSDPECDALQETVRSSLTEEQRLDAA